MRRIKLLKTLLVAVLQVLLIVNACTPRAPGGDTEGDSAGNNQPDAGKKAQCLSPQKININPVAYVETAGLTYGATAVLMDGECNAIKINGENFIKVTLVAIDSRGSRMEPILNSSPQESPYTAKVLFPLPTSYSLELEASGNMNRNQVKDSGTIFIACALFPMGKDTGAPSDAQISDIGPGKGSVSCRVASL